MGKAAKPWTEKDLRNPDSWDELLTEDEVGWLEARDRHRDVKENAEEFGGPEPDEYESDPGMSPQVRSALNPAHTTTVVQEVLPPAPDAVEDDYDDWKVAELRKECDGREPPVEYTADMKKAQLIAALRAWDAAHPEATAE